jgi:hypothetical protein
VKLLLLLTVLISLASVGGISAAPASAAEVEGPFYIVEHVRQGEEDTAEASGTAKKGLTLEATGGQVVKCTSNAVKAASIAGSVSKSAGHGHVTIEFTGCTVTGNGTGCKVEGEKFTTTELTSTLGYGAATREGAILELLKPASGAFATIKFTKECTVTSTTLEGSLAGQEWVAGKAVSVGENEGQSKADEVAFPKTAKTIWTESSGKLTEQKPALKAFGATTTFEVTVSMELAGGLNWGVGASLGTLAALFSFEPNIRHFNNAINTPQAFTITNLGLGEVELTAHSLGGLNPGFFQITDTNNCFKKGLTNGQSCAITIKLVMAMVGSAQYNGTIDDPPGSPLAFRKFLINP